MAFRFTTKFTLIFLILLIFSAMYITKRTFAASWWAGNMRSNAYGVEAKIWTPANLLPQTIGQSNWVSIPPPFWLQTGWLFQPGDYIPTSYYEWCIAPCSPDDNIHNDKKLQLLSSHTWNTFKKYKVEYASGEIWCAYVNDVFQDCAVVSSAPNTVEALSETHHPNNELDTLFSEVKYKMETPNGNYWYYFDQDAWFEAFPILRVEKDLPYSQSSYHVVNTYPVFLPLTIK